MSPITARTLSLNPTPFSFVLFAALAAADASVTSDDIAKSSAEPLLEQGTEGNLGRIFFVSKKTPAPALKSGQKLI
jgi:hypothetical protein